MNAQVTVNWIESIRVRLDRKSARIWRPFPIWIQFDPISDASFLAAHLTASVCHQIWQRCLEPVQHLFVITRSLLLLPALLPWSIMQMRTDDANCP